MAINNCNEQACEKHPNIARADCDECTPPEDPPFFAPTFADNSSMLLDKDNPSATDAIIQSLCDGFADCQKIDTAFFQKLNTYIYWLGWRQEQHMCVACSVQQFGDAQDTLNVALITGPFTGPPGSSKEVHSLNQATGSTTLLATAAPASVEFNALGADKTSGDAFMIDKITGDLWAFTYATNALTNLGNVITPAQASTTNLGAFSFADNKLFIANTEPTVTPPAAFTDLDVFAVDVNTLLIAPVPGLTVTNLDSGPSLSGGPGFDFDFDVSGRLWLQYGLKIYYADPPFASGWTFFYDLTADGIINTAGALGVQSGKLNGQNQASTNLYSLDIASQILTVGPSVAFVISDMTNLPIETCVPFLRETCGETVTDTLLDGTTPYTPTGTQVPGGCP